MRYANKLTSSRGDYNVSKWSCVFVEMRGVINPETLLTKGPYCDLMWCKGYSRTIPRMRVGYDQLTGGRGVEHRVGYHKLISNKRERNNCFIKYQTLDKNISNFHFYRLQFSATFEGKFPVITLSVTVFGQTTGYRIYTANREPIRLPEIQYAVFGI